MSREIVRSCIFCRRSAPKRTLLRFVVKEDGIVWDRQHSISGRGAYMHPKIECWGKMRESGRWEHALKLAKGSLFHANKDSTNVLVKLMEQVRSEIPDLASKPDAQDEDNRKKKVRI